MRGILREARASLKNREDELADSKALIRLLSDQLEHAQKRIASLTDFTMTQTIESPSQEEVEKPLTPQTSESVGTTPVESPVSLVSLESSIRSHSEDESQFKEYEDPITKIGNPLYLEHSPRIARRQSIRGQIFPPLQRTSFYERAQISLTRNSIPVTPAVTRVNVEKTQLPPTPEDTPVPVKVANPKSTLRSRIFRSKSDLRETKSEPTAHPPLNSVVKKNSLIRFWKPKSANKKDYIKTHTVPKEVYPPSPETTALCETTKPVPRQSDLSSHRESIKFTAPHESDKLSCYPKVRPASLVTTQNTSTTRNAEWRQTIGRQVAEMVQHWEDESSKQNQNIVSCASYLSSKRVSSSSLKDVNVNPFVVRAARDAWTAKSIVSTETGSRTSSFRSLNIEEGVKKRSFSANIGKGCACSVA